MGLLSIFRRKPNNNRTKTKSPNRTGRLRAVVRAKIGASRWAARARKTVANRGRPMTASPRRNNNRAPPSRNYSTMRMYVPGVSGHGRPGYFNY